VWGLGLRVRVSGQHDCIVGSALWGLQVRVWPLAFKGSQPLLHSAGERLRHADKGRVRVEESHSGHPTRKVTPVILHGVVSPEFRGCGSLAQGGVPKMR